MPRPRNRARGALNRELGKALAEQVVTLEERLKAESDLKGRTDLELRLARVAARLLDQCSPEARVATTNSNSLHRMSGVKSRPPKVPIRPEFSAAIRHITALVPEWLVWREFQGLRLGQDHSESVTEQGRD
ncbi:hypothetical protein [Deinococcus sedimenti]|uniref:Uncharacterized protein n=1 Tax=Deinococcus sedimenti TaxID=1867090 RepID=A0ABQ2S0C8_9DEIO|nr:hypothetical protein [Deinococcus sedimenti]GGR84329.1 hypothetical protein GCM10008960_09190 [Deinococcus sedimenti]